jgi:hypothetical protein
MTAIRTRTRTTLVWIDAREAIIVRGVAVEDPTPAIERLESDVPAHHRSTGQVRHVPLIRHGGGGGAQTAEDPRRLEHLARFVDDVAQRLPEDDHVLILGPGTVGERLARELKEADGHRGRERDVIFERSSRLTDRQLVARLREHVGLMPKRIKVSWHAAE